MYSDNRAILESNNEINILLYKRMKTEEYYEKLLNIFKLI